jgi:hypothetical protein
MYRLALGSKTNEDIEDNRKYGIGVKSNYTQMC